MLDVDGVVVSGRPSDGLPWMTDLKRDLGIDPTALNEAFFKVYWPKIIVGQADSLACLTLALQKMNSSVPASRVLSYWFEMDSGVDHDVLNTVVKLREQGVRVYLTTNQDHLRAAYLMNDMRLKKAVGGIIYSARLGFKKPDQPFFQAAEAITLCTAEQHLLVDDTTENVEAARAQGWQVLHWTKASKVQEIRDMLAAQSVRGFVQDNLD